jgi:hypothetical protein
LLGRTVSVEEVIPSVVRRFGQVFGLEMQVAALSQLPTTNLPPV